MEFLTYLKNVVVKKPSFTLLCRSHPALTGNGNDVVCKYRRETANNFPVVTK